MKQRSVEQLSVKPALLILLSTPSTVFAHGGPELFVLIWSVILIPVILVTWIARKGFRRYWFLAAFGLMLVNVMLIATEITGLPIHYHLVATWLLIPVVIWHRWVTSETEKNKHEQ